MNNPKADWLGIVVHFFFGALVGFCVGLKFTHYNLAFACSIAIAVGAVAGLNWQSFWGDNYRVIPPIPIQHTPISRAVLWVLAIAGSLYLPANILKHYFWW